MSSQIDPKILARQIANDATLFRDGIAIHLQMHETASANAGKHRLPAKLWNTLSECTLQASLSAGARLLDSTKSSVSLDGIEKHGFALTDDLRDRRDAMLQKYKDNGLKTWRNKILSHRDGRQSAEDSADRAKLSIHDVIADASDLADWVNEFVKLNWPDASPMPSVYPNPEELRRQTEKMTNEMCGWLGVSIRSLKDRPVDEVE